MASTLIFPILLIIMAPIIIALYFINQLIWCIHVLASIPAYGYFLFLIWPVLPSRRGTRKVLLGTLIFLQIIFLLSFFH
ncbi:MAG: hypothetical protein ACTSRP_19670 [Candidatus Helarchaeota archaeon]